jgi:hypothetical protein
LRSDRLNLIHNLEAFDDLAEDDMLAIQMRSVPRANEELATIGVWSGIGHRETAFACVLTCLTGEALIGKFSTIDGLSTTTISQSEIAALAHEAGDDAVEGGAFEMQRHTTLPHPLFTSA